MRVQARPWGCWPRSFQGWREPAKLGARRKLCPHLAEDAALFADVVLEKIAGTCFVKKL